MASDATTDLGMGELENPGAVLTGDILENSKYAELRFEQLSHAYVNRVLNRHDENDKDGPLIPECWWKFVETHHRYQDWLQKLAKTEFSPGSMIVWFGPSDGSTYLGQEFRVMYEDKSYWHWLSSPHYEKELDYSKRARQIEKELKEFELKYPLEEKRLSQDIYFDADLGRYRKRYPIPNQTYTAYLYYVDERTHETISSSMKMLEIEGSAQTEGKAEAQPRIEAEERLTNDDSPNRKRKREDTPPPVFVKSEVIAQDMKPEANYVKQEDDSDHRAANQKIESRTVRIKTEPGLGDVNQEPEPDCG